MALKPELTGGLVRATLKVVVTIAVMVTQILAQLSKAPVQVGRPRKAPSGG